MTAADVVELVGYLLGSFALGVSASSLFRVFVKYASTIFHIS